MQKIILEAKENEEKNDYKLKSIIRSIIVTWEEEEEKNKK